VETPANPESFILDVMDNNDLKDQEELVFEEDTESVSANVKDALKANTISVLPSLKDGSVQDELSVVGDRGRSPTLLGINASVDSDGAEVDEVVNQSEVNEMENTNEKRIVELIEKNAVLTKAADDATHELAEASKANDELKEQNAELEAKLEEKLSEIKEREEELAAKAEAAEKLEAEKAELEAKLEETSAKLSEIEEARKLEARTAELSALGLSEERVARTIAKTSELDDEAFATEVEDLKSLISEFETEASEKEDAGDEKAEAEAKSEKEKANAEASEAKEEDLTEVLDELEEEEAPVADAIASASTSDDDVDADEVFNDIFAKALGVRLDAK